MENFISKFTKKEIISYIMLILNAVICIYILNYGEFHQKYNLMLIGLLIIFAINILFCCLDIKHRVILALFHLAMFLFLLSRITIPAVQGSEWWKNFTFEGNIFALYAISTSMLSLASGAVLVEVANKLSFRPLPINPLQQLKDKTGIDKKRLMQTVRIILIACMICFLIKEAEKVFIMRGKPYEYYFSHYKSNLPFVITAPAGCMQFFLCMFLAFKPSKKESFLWLGVYILSAFPMLKIGMRNPIILNCLFAFVYCFLRNASKEDDEKSWISKKAVFSIILAAPLVVIFLGAYNYIRDENYEEAIPANLIVDFAYKQGTTYDTILQGYQNKERLPASENRIYTLGALTDSILHNSLGKIIFKPKDLGDGNGLKQVYNGNAFSHVISYAVLGKDYIAGEGRGSSYIIENYIDFGYPGIIIFSIFLGAVCVGIPYVFGKHWITSIICLNIITSVFFTPRAESTAFITFLFSYKFWICIIGSVFICIAYEHMLQNSNYKKEKNYN